MHKQKQPDSGQRCVCPSDPNEYLNCVRWKLGDVQCVPRVEWESMVKRGK